MPYAFAWLLGLILAMMAGSVPGFAQQRVYHARSGQPTVVGEFFNCGAVRTPPAASARAANGTVTSRQATGNRCGRSNYPVLQMIYTSRPGFRGEDKVFYYGPPMERRKVIVR